MTVSNRSSHVSIIVLKATITYLNALYLRPATAVINILFFFQSVRFRVAEVNRCIDNDTE